MTRRQSRCRCSVNAVYPIFSCVNFACEVVHKPILTFFLSKNFLRLIRHFLWVLNQVKRSLCNTDTVGCIRHATEAEAWSPTSAVVAMLKFFICHLVFGRDDMIIIVYNAGRLFKRWSRTAFLRRTNILLSHENVMSWLMMVDVLVA